MRRAALAAIALAVAAAMAPVVPSTLAVGDPPHDSELTVPSHSFPDPFVIRVGSTYYAYGTDGDLGEVQVLSSSGANALASWSNEGDAMGSAPSFAQPNDVWAPAVLHVGASDFVLYAAFEQASSGLRCIGILSSSSPAGPFTPEQQTCFVADDAQGGVIDPTVYSSGGAHWLLWKTEGVEGSTPPRIYSRRLSADGRSLTGTAALLLQSTEPWEGTLIENPFLVEDGGRLYLFYSGNEWESSAYAVGWALCESVAGPCVRPPNRTLLHTEAPHLYGPGGGSVFQDETGQWWFAFAAWNDSRTTEATGERGLYLRRLRFIDGRPYLDVGGDTYATSELVARVGGVHRYDTAALLSANTVQARRPVTYVATGTSYHDALIAAPASGIEDSPVLLVERDRIPESVLAELTRLTPGHIVVMGGTDAISQAVYDELATRFGPLHREAGVHVYHRSALVSRNTFDPGVPVAYVATGAAFADALAGGAAGAANGGPMLFVEPNSLPSDVASELDRLNPQRIVVLGGPAAVSHAVLAQVGQYGPTSRIAGVDRYETAALVARTEFDRPIGGLVLATGQTFPDAIAAGAAGHPVLLVPSTGAAPQVVKDALAELAPLGIVVMGGTAAVSDGTLDSLGL